MTQDKIIIAMAREACLHNQTLDTDPEFLTRFAALVAAHEREECAKVCEARYNSPNFNNEAIECADAIRARGE